VRHAFNISLQLCACQGIYRHYPDRRV
jgi:hypothetical protein